ncbi:MAG: hypothetical protein EBT41_06605 [Betaproteobacteria bacterium]|nr:hypothetical protein [Betaproteobacteria bacterium]
MKSMTFFGGGHMASAMIAGMQRANQLPPHLMLVDPDAQARQRWSDCYGARTFEHVAQEPCLSDCWLMAVKPQQMKSLCAAIAGLHAQPSRCVISVAAGIRLARLQSWLGPQHRYIRCMPNTPAALPTRLDTVDSKRPSRSSRARKGSGGRMNPSTKPCSLRA